MFFIRNNSMIMKLMKAIDVNVILGNDEQQPKWKQIRLFNLFFRFSKVYITNYIYCIRFGMYKGFKYLPN